MNLILIIAQALACFGGLVESKLAPEERKRLDDIRLPLYNNLALCCLKLNEITKAIENSQKVGISFILSFLEKEEQCITRLSRFWR